MRLWKLPKHLLYEDIFLVFRTLLNCLKCIIYEDCYRLFAVIYGSIIALTDKNRVTGGQETCGCHQFIYMKK